MKIVDLNILRGPNYWSTSSYHQLVVLHIDLEELNNVQTNQVVGFYEQLEDQLPSLQEHRCTDGSTGGFLRIVQKGTSMAHVVEHVALEIQTLAGMPCGFGRTRKNDSALGSYDVVFSYEIERAGTYAAKAAIRFTEALANHLTYNLAEDISQLQKIKIADGLGPSTAAIVDEARRKNIPYRRMNTSSLVKLGYGIHLKKICAGVSSITSLMGVENAGNKVFTKEILRNGCIPTASWAVVKTVDEMKKAIKDLGYPLVSKPINGNHGRGITTNISSYIDALKAFYVAQSISKEVLFEKFLAGADYRFLVINYKLVAVAKRTPALVIGDGKSTIRKLIELTNNDPNRGNGHEKNLTTIKIDELTEKILTSNHLHLESVLPIGQILFVKDTANLSTGGTSTDVTDLVHPANVFMAERISRLMDLDICGIDVVSQSIEVPINGKNGAVLEVNACPGLRMHLNPSHGLPRNVARPVVDMLFPEGTPSRIPIIAITGSNGKTTTTRLVAHMAMLAGYQTGYTTSDGIYIQNHLIQSGDCTGPRSAESVLSDPNVELAVLECARGGILRSGLSFDRCNISIITNVTEDHLGLKGINSLEEMAHVKAVVAESTMHEGTAVLNADDDLVYGMMQRLKCNIALFSVDALNPRIITHCKAGGLVAYIQNDFLMIQKGDWKKKIEHVHRVPLTFSGRAESMIKNILPATLAAFIQNIRIEDIVKALQTFAPSPEQTPGRMNVFSFKKFDVLLDYAHNPSGFIELKKFVDRTNASSKIGIITAVGDRRDEDIKKVGSIAAEIFDRIIIKHDDDLRGRSKEAITGLLMDGIREKDEQIPVEIISNEIEAIKYAMNTCEQGALITITSDDIKTSLDFLKTEKNKEEEDDKHYEYIFSESSKIPETFQNADFV
jgi:cyanophycin synthetase